METFQRTRPVSLASKFDKIKRDKQVSFRSHQIACFVLFHSLGQFLLDLYESLLFSSFHFFCSALVSLPISTRLKLYKQLQAELPSRFLGHPLMLRILSPIFVGPPQRSFIRCIMLEKKKRKKKELLKRIFYLKIQRQVNQPSRFSPKKMTMEYAMLM